MRQFIFSIVTLFMTMPVWAQNAEIEAVITRQIEAFQRDDFAQAFTFAAPSIQSMFGNPERFGQMVRNGYPMVYRPKDLDFQELRTEGRALFQDVLIEDQRGQFYIARYEMVQIDGQWRIAGVTLERAEMLGA